MGCFDYWQGMTNYIRISAETPWYELFSRGARDWLRHNQKVRQAVRDNLLDIIAGTDVITNPTDRTMRVPVRLLEHARFRLADAETQNGAGQGQGQPGDVLRPARPEQGDDAGEGGNKDGEVKLMLELKIDDIVDWLWDELKLPNLKPRPASNLDERDLVREGWGKRGIRARLDRRLVFGGLGRHWGSRKSVLVDGHPTADVAWLHCLTSRD